jgi:hypothetical protein
VACDLPPRQCFTWHIAPNLKGAKHGKRDDGTIDPYSVRATCPAHDDREPSLGVSVGDNGKVIWNCFACKDRPKVRMALHRVYGIGLGCLPLAASEKQDVLDYLADLLAADTKNHAEIRLRALAAIEGHRGLPNGAELGRLARLARVSHGAAWQFLKRPDPSHHR